MELEKLDAREWAIGLFKYNGQLVTAGTFRDFYFLVTEIAKELSLELTYVGAEGDGYSGKLVKYSKRIDSKLNGSNFSGISVLALYANPLGSDEPSYDRFFSASLSYVPEKKEVFACVTLNNAIVGFESVQFENLLSRLLKLSDWDFGQAFIDTIERQPDFHLMGIDNGELSSSELEALTKWYGSSAKERVEKLRAVYPYNLVNETQLKLSISGKSLREIIERDNDSQLKPTEIPGLFLWIAKGDLSFLQNKLSSAGVTIT